MTISAATRRPSAGFFRWEDPSEPIPVHFHLNTIELMERDAVRAGTSPTAGILLGKRDENRYLAFMVENYEPIPAPAWKTTDSPFGDHRQLRAMVDRWQARTDKRLSVIGFYRNSVSEESSLGPDDLAVIKENSPQQETIFLLVQTRSGKSSVGRLFLIKDSTVTFEWAPTPFNRAELSGRGMPRPPADSDPAQAEKPASQRVERQAKPESQEEIEEEIPAIAAGMPKQVKWAIAAMGIVMLLVLGLFQFHHGSTHPISPDKLELNNEASLGLRLDRSGTDWQLSWNANSPAVLKATRGQLLITDGAFQKTVNLGASDLRSGTIIYSPLTDDVVLKLEVSRDDSSEPNSEAIRAVGGLSTGSPLTATSINPSSQTPATSIESVRPVLSEEELHVLGSRPPAGKSSHSPADLAPYAPFERKPPSESQTNLPDRRRNTRTLKPQVASAHTIPSKLNPKNTPTTNAVVAGNDPNGPAFVAPRGSAGMKASAPAETVPVIPARSVESMSDSTLRPARRGGTVQPAQLVSNINPGYPASAKDEGISGTVELHFKIGPTGDVHDISVIKGPTILAQAAVQAVRDRKYKPARVDGVPTETDASAIFDFKLN